MALWLMPAGIAAGGSWFGGRKSSLLGRENQLGFCFRKNHDWWLENSSASLDMSIRRATHHKCKNSDRQPPGNVPERSRYDVITIYHNAIMCSHWFSFLSLWVKQAQRKSSPLVTLLHECPQLQGKLFFHPSRFYRLLAWNKNQIYLTEQEWGDIPKSSKIICTRDFLNLIVENCLQQG